MVLYDYRCTACGVVELARPAGAATPAEPCPACGRPARRVYSPPALTRPGSPLRRAHEASERSAHEPHVAGTPPAARRRPPRPANPLHARLPPP